jgi:hypothetical protein
MRSSMQKHDFVYSKEFTPAFFALILCFPA